VVLTKYTKQILRAAEPLELMRDREWRCREAAVAERRMHEPLDCAASELIGDGSRVIGCHSRR